MFLASITCLGIATYNSSINETIDSSNVGLALKHILTVPIYLYWLVRFIIDTEICLNAVERVKEFSNMRNENTPLGKI